MGQRLLAHSVYTDSNCPIIIPEIVSTSHLGTVTCQFIHEVEVEIIILLLFPPPV
jgi:hypothetical protein